MKRLKESVSIEKKLIMSQMQTQFDMVQAQVNPHFIYNVLSVVSSRGMQEDDEVICEICGSLAAMLRYSTGTEVKVEFAQEMMGIKIPKVSIQQLVENSIEHGCRDKSNKMEIFVRAYTGVSPSDFTQGKKDLTN